MTLELHKVASQVRVMGQSLADQTAFRETALTTAQRLLEQVSSEFTALNERIAQAEKVQQKQRFDWVGAAPTTEALAEAYPLPDCPDRLTVMASDGSQILPDQHAITLYYLINVGSIIYRHGSDQKPEVYQPQPVLRYSPEDILDEQGRLIASSEVTVRRDLAELEVLAELAARPSDDEPLIALMDGQITLRVIDLPFHQQEIYQNDYIDRLNALREAGVLVGGYIDRPRSTFVLALIHLAALEVAQITEESLRHNQFRTLTDLDLFTFLGPGERSAIFATKAKGLDKYTYFEQNPHFFYLNVSNNAFSPQLARIEIPAWLASNPDAVDLLHAAIVRQARLTGGYPYVLARADELAIISP
ncbi:MAG: DNA double-strand break repair nuclease NurA, partial [Anaerolineae bacterium]|nr:DNA double-strand break repair nuclease NurA [Anaerolineae bacterium]